MADANSTVAALREQDAARRTETLTSATHQLEAIFDVLLYLVRQERGEVPAWPDFDADGLPDVRRALAIRGLALSRAIMGARLNELSTEDFESAVFHG